jgi:hypothetical protein
MDSASTVWKEFTLMASVYRESISIYFGVPRFQIQWWTG